ncbi:MAG TPA: FHA domain-containing protein [Pirellulales bacterium]|nr:FHA domain-containing protein [Pirellulales bacterium]
MEVRLKVLVGKNVGQELLVPGPKFFIGRAEDCQLRPRSDLISRHHCVLLIEDDFVAVRDFGSKNGTLVNDQRILGERELKSGDKLVIGPLEFQVLVQSAVPASASAAPVTASATAVSSAVSPAASKKRPKVESVREAAARTAEGHRSEANGEEGSVDVSQWLTEKDPDGTAETRAIKLNETGEIDVTGRETAAGANGKSAEPEPAAAPAGAPKAGEKRLPGKLPLSAKNGADDSRSAAADVLNKFFKRR